MLRRAHLCLFGPCDDERFRAEEDGELVHERRKLAPGAAAEVGRDDLARAERRVASARREAQKHFKQFCDIPVLLLDLEFYFAITIVALADTILGMLLLPWKTVLAPRQFSLRDALSVFTVTVGIATFTALSSGNQLYPLLYHIVRRTSFIKLVMVFSILDVLDQLISSLTIDAMEVLYVSSGEAVLRLRRWWRRTRGAATPGSPPRAGDARRGSVTAAPDSRGPASRPSWVVLLGSAATASLCVAVHSVVLLLHVVTLNVAINAEGNAWLALIISNNFSEVKSVVFKKHIGEALHQRCAADALERLQFIIFVLAMMAHHMNEQFGDIVASDVALMLLSEIAIDFMKHVFVATFNGISLSIYSTFSQLTLLDVASETTLWRLPNLHIVCKDDGSHYPTPDPAAVRQLLRPSHGFFPKYAKRAGFVPMPYVALLLWSGLPFAWLTLLQAPLLFAMAATTVVLLKLATAEGLRGMTCRFVVRTLVVTAPQPQPPPPASDAPADDAVTGASPSASRAQHRGPPSEPAGEPRQLKAAVAEKDLLLGISPLVSRGNSPSQRPLDTNSTSTMSASGAAAAWAPAKTVIQLTYFICALLRVQRFDLQAGKSKG